MTAKTELSQIPQRAASPPDEMTKAITGLNGPQQQEILRRLSKIAEGKPKDWGPDDLAKMAR